MATNKNKNKSKNDLLVKLSESGSLWFVKNISSASENNCFSVDEYGSDAFKYSIIIKTSIDK